MSVNSLTKREITAMVVNMEKIISKLQINGIPAHGFINTPDALHFIGDYAITDHIKNHLEEITMNPKYNSPPPKQTDFGSIKAAIEELRLNNPEESTMNSNVMRLFAIKLLATVTPACGQRGRYQNKANRPTWFPIEMPWEQLNVNNHDELRKIISACYEYYGIDAEVIPSGDTTNKHHKRPRSKTTSSTQTNTEDAFQNSPVKTNEEKLRVYRDFIPSNYPKRLRTIRNFTSPKGNTNHDLPILKKNPSSPNVMRRLNAKNGLSYKTQGQEQSPIITNKDVFWNPPSEAWRNNMCGILGISIATDNLKYETPSKYFSIYDVPLDKHYILGDGNCFYRSINAIVTGSDLPGSNNYLIVKEKLFDFMEKNPIGMKMVTMKNDYALTTETKERDAWATDYEIKAMASLLKTTIAVYCMDTNKWLWQTFEPHSRMANPPFNDHLIYLHNVNKNHYEPVLRV